MRLYFSDLVLLFRNALKRNDVNPFRRGIFKKKFALKTEPDEKTPKHAPEFEGGK